MRSWLDFATATFICCSIYALLQARLTYQWILPLLKKEVACGRKCELIRKGVPPSRALQGSIVATCCLNAFNAFWLMHYIASFLFAMQLGGSDGLAAPHEHFIEGKSRFKNLIPSTIFLCGRKFFLGESMWRFSGQYFHTNN